MDKIRKKIALTWGSTWGHIFPLVATYNYLTQLDKYNFIWIWEEDSLEEKISIKSKIEFLYIPCWKIRRYFDFRNFYEPLKNLTGIFYWIYYIIKNNIDIIFSKWWYVALPLCIAAFLCRKKIYIHESDTVSWIANIIIWKIATKIFYTFDNKKIDNKKYFKSWQILNSELIDWLTNINIEQNEKLEVFVIGWTQGSKTIFEWLIKILPDLEDINFNIILWEKNISFKQYFKNFSNVITYDFLNQKEIGQILKNTDIAVTRWGSTTLWELNMFWIHSIIIPLSSSAGNHQNINANYFNEKFWSDVLDENNNFEVELFRKLIKYKDLRKNDLNLEWFFKPLNFIENNI